MGYAMRSQGRFVFLSSSEVFDGDYPDDIPESEPTAPGNYRSMALAQAEEMCDSFRRIRNLDVMILRIDNLYSMPTNRKECDDVVSKMCLEELSTKAVSITNGDVISLIYVTDAVEFIYRAAAAKEHNEYLYNISSGVPIEKTALANMVQQAFGEPENIKYDDDNKPKRIVLSNLVYDSEFGKPYCCEVSDMIKKIAADMKNNPYVYLTGEEVKEPLLKRIQKKIGWFVKAIVPFVENIIAFVPFFMLNNRTVGSEYFRNLDFYLLYVLLFAIVYGQQQATFSAVLAVAGYLFRQAYERSGFELMLDANTYVWMSLILLFTASALALVRPLAAVATMASTCRLTLRCSSTTFRISTPRISELRMRWKLR